jgi:hypothetical protein
MIYIQHRGLVWFGLARLVALVGYILSVLFREALALTVHKPPLFTATGLLKIARGETVYARTRSFARWKGPRGGAGERLSTCKLNVQH